jgi:hypothetical protein
MVSIYLPGFCIASCSDHYILPFIEISPVGPRMQTTLNVPVITPRTALEVRVVRLRLGLRLGLVLGCLVGAAVVGNG